MKEEQDIEFLYLKTSDRGMYINFMNTMIKKVLGNDTVSDSKKIDLLSVGTQMIYEEVEFAGINKQMSNEINDLCESMYKVATQSSQITDYLKDYFSIENKSHTFKVAFLSILIAKKLPWCSDRVIKILGTSAILHDIGKIKFSNNLKGKYKFELSNDELIEYNKHPEFGVELLRGNQIISEPILQVIYQHHECVNAVGFPNQLSGTKIYPLAKIVSLADFFSNLLEVSSKNTVESLTEFVTSPKDVLMFEPEFVRELIKCFIKDKSKE